MIFHFTVQLLFPGSLKSFSLFFLDINECFPGGLLSEHERLAHICHNDANCTNTKGSYYCDCLAGYSGDGITCQGSSTFFPLLWFVLIESDFFPFLIQKEQFWPRVLFWGIVAMKKGRIPYLFCFLACWYEPWYGNFLSRYRWMLHWWDFKRLYSSCSQLWHWCKLHEY